MLNQFNGVLCLQPIGSIEHYQLNFVSMNMEIFHVYGDFVHVYGGFVSMYMENLSMYMEVLFLCIWRFISMYMEF